MKGCKNCPAYAKCTVTYRGSACAALRGTYGIESDPEIVTNADSADLAQMTACVYYKPGGLCRYGGDDPANVCVLGPCPHERTAEEVLADLARMTAERDAIERDFREFTKQWWEEANGFPCRFCRFENSGGCEQKEKHPDDEKPCAGRWFEWCGIKKED